MPTLKFSRQREAIKGYLAGTKEHPTADTVYAELKKDYPNISLGTVYRNLNLLVDMGEIIKIPTSDGGIRFDYDVSDHCHLICEKCGRVEDISLDESIISSINDQAQSTYDGLVKDHEIQFFGLCKHCLEETNTQ
ncbi:Fe2+ or Zn2+ uptake regulation protein [Lachnospiraceae bacterium PF1-21]|uniref:Fur family transcriptional regulator n=1 Tax=Ohessyouella blattaphilus TaxID=2949333 RepID=UPI00256BB5BE|nr:transcriptional repressor [Lachnospiraceae bacterium OttesenSCG-928-J05]